MYQIDREESSGVFYSPHLLLMERLELAARQQHGHTMHVFLGTELAHHFTVAGLAIVEKADSWVFHVFHSLGYVLILQNWLGVVNY